MHMDMGTMVPVLGQATMQGTAMGTMRMGMGMGSSSSSSRRLAVQQTGFDPSCLMLLRP